MTFDAERPSRSRSELGVRPLPVREAALRHGREHEALPFAERDVSVAVVEVARERDLELLADAEGPVRLDVDSDVGREKREIVGVRDSRKDEGDDDERYQPSAKTRRPGRGSDRLQGFSRARILRN